jgi:hypothetical protein
MKDSVEKILLNADDDIQCEWPSDFAWEKELDRVHAIKPKIEKVLGCELVLDDSIQDASYFASLALLKYVPPDPNLYTAPGIERGGTYYSIICISFSCFGNLSTIGSSVDPKERFPNEKIDSVGNILNENGYIYIPEEYLLEKYNGNNPHFKDSTWGERFFSVL